MARGKTDGERAIAERVAKGKDPERALKRAFPDRDIGEVLWAWLAEGFVPLSDQIGALAGQTAERAPVDAIVRAAGRLPRHPLRSASMAWSVSQSYRARAAEWDARFDALPREVQLLLLAPRRARDRQPIPAELCDEAVALYALAAVDGDHDHYSLLSGAAEDLGVDKKAFTRRVAAHLEADPPITLQESDNLVAPLGHAPWPVTRRILATWRSESRIHRVLELRADSREDLQQFLRERGLEASPEFVELLAHRTEAQGQTVSESLDPTLVARFANGHGDARSMALVERFPPERLEAFASAVRATGTRALCCLGLLRDPQLDAEVSAELWGIIEDGISAKDYRTVLVSASRTLAGVAAAGSYGYALLERILDRARTIEENFGARLAFAVYPAQIRFQLRRAMFRATAGSEPRPLDLLLPGDDLLRVADLVDVFGTFANGWELLDDLSDDERGRVLAAWARLDWDGTLDTCDPPSRVHAPPPIEEMPWPKLAAAIEQTSYPRLVRGESERTTVTRALRRAPSTTEKVALVDRMLARVTTWSMPVLRGLKPLITAVLPAWLEEARPLEGAREAACYGILRAGADGDLRALLLRLPAPQVDGWLSRMQSDPDRTVKKRWKELAGLHRASA
ncbi:hypothetical protein [Nannocystis radixulma]|uniref:Uncharacterized protein n=1 Tax=Nannocystis radixulma TaxID=2995305 RepID=A0ABT5B5P9_9BACT|nr:hypothetical protein [Nannocystis radixulma]MDC0669436.1 hypothetical protein [Nannocystis radixulma]